MCAEYSNDIATSGSAIYNKATVKFRIDPLNAA